MTLLNAIYRSIIRTDHFNFNFRLGSNAFILAVGQGLSLQGSYL